MSTVIAAVLAGIPGAMNGSSGATASGRTFVVTSYEYTFQAPDSIAAGVVTVRLVNRGKDVHQVSFALLDDTTTVVRAMRDLAENKKRTTGVTWSGGVENALAGGTSEATLILRPGRYVIVCAYEDITGHAHMSYGMLRALTVTSGASPGDTLLPATTVTARLTDYAINFSTPLTKGRQLVRVENDGVHRHHLIVARMLGHATVDDVMKWDGTSKPAPIEDIGAGAAVLEPGRASVIPLTLARGRYLFGCIMNDSSGAPPHYMLGMQKEVAID
ncbi:MAG TPA: hypothetical protein VK511_05930 [Gemmatimonadaceae bacterium]|nr:hypothetical protein [Gemmatimonadaceae bacterium]